MRIINGVNWAICTGTSKAIHDAATIRNKYRKGYYRGYGSSKRIFPIYHFNLKYPWHEWGPNASKNPRSASIRFTLRKQIQVLKLKELFPL